MATSQHEGHANQLDLLIRAGNTILDVCDFGPEAGARARGCVCSPRPRRVCSAVLVRESNGGQSGSDHLGSDLHGVATQSIKPGFLITLRNSLPSERGAGRVHGMFCTCARVLPIELGPGITVYTGGAQPGSAEMLSFLRLCHAVCSRKDMWFYFRRCKSEACYESLLKKKKENNFAYICVASTAL